MFNEGQTSGEISSIFPFIRQWSGRTSRFSWQDKEGVSHNIYQGEGGEQGDALMPALFCVALRNAFDTI